MSVLLRAVGKLKRQECADQCAQDLQCFSFVYDQTEMTCNLKKEMEPNATGKYNEYLFCKKDGRVLHIFATHMSNILQIKTLLALNTFHL